MAVLTSKSFPKKKTVIGKGRTLLGYCLRCGRDVDVDFCDHCGIAVQ